MSNASFTKAFSNFCSKFGLSNSKNEDLRSSPLEENVYDKPHGEPGYNDNGGHGENYPCSNKGFAVPNTDQGFFNFQNNSNMKPSNFFPKESPPPVSSQRDANM